MAEPPRLPPIMTACASSPRRQGKEAIALLKRNKRQLALLLSIIAFLSVGYFLVRPKLPDYTPYVSSSPAADGTKGLYTLLEEKGEPVGAWRKPWRSLPDTQGHTLVVIQPSFLTEQDRTAALRWVERGNDLLLFHSSPPPWAPFEFLEANSAVADEPAVPIADLQRPERASWTAAVRSGMRIEAGEGIEPLLQDKQGFIAARSSHGSGTVTMLLVPEWLENGSLLSQSHFELLWPYLPRDREAIWFDEYHHGLQDKPGLLAVYPGWLLAVLAQLAAAALLWLWLKAVRFGPAYTPRAWTVRRGDETLLAAAGWYERQELARDALMHQEAYIRSLLREKWGVRTDATDSQALGAAKLHGNKEDAELLAGLLAAFHSARSSAVYRSKQLVQDSRRADELIRRLERK
ncbi:protein of unknown function [Paenibacillus sp. UNCCL117]|uniref:DUF4350 domain-containing protein n=1 Tax=unclassified Paenibacillus TaxID=185978 RepID=UPI00088EFF9B|nr:MULTISPECIES: DUF4350 domain-containing protein [unclassified Paenibacillus]SDD40327.1 protein of unknown function [Paenibacillus sp. cl123]SFW48131.1 protein of unknown function [Paenibacillus sp. UNCCL117]